jgi:LysM repeat protein
MFVRILLIALAVTFLGWTLLIRESAATGPTTTYVVQQGDTLWSIAAARYAGDPREGVWKLQQRNDLAGATISPGERLVLP